MNWDEVVTVLEGKYADRGLKFTSPFEGLAPIQAYGHLDGKRFYFRLRGGSASLRVGVYDKAIEVEKKKTPMNALDTLPSRISLKSQTRTFTLQ